MFSDIFFFLVEVFLYRADFKHRKKVSNLENFDGKKRPIQKYLLGPSLVIGVSIIALAIIIGMSVNWYNNSVLLPERTRQEMEEISKALEDWKAIHDSYPKELEELIQGRPMRIEWMKDSWNRHYSYFFEAGSNRFSLISSGKDGLLGSPDDIKTNQ